MTAKILQEKKVGFKFRFRFVLSRSRDILRASLYVTVAILPTFDSYLRCVPRVRIFLVLKLLECCVAFCKFPTVIKPNLSLFL